MNFFEQLGLLSVPLLECLEWGLVVQVFLRDVVIIQIDEAFEGGLQGGGGVEAVGAQDVSNTAIEAFDHAIGLRAAGLGQAMRDAVVGTDPIEGMGAGGLALAGGTEAIGELLAIVGEHPGDLKRGFVNQSLEESSGGGC